MTRENTEYSTNDLKCNTSTKSNQFFVTDLLKWLIVRAPTMHSVCDASRAVKQLVFISHKIIIHLRTYSKVNVYHICLFH